MSEIKLSTEVLNEIRLLTQKISTSSPEELQREFDTIKEKMDLPEVTSKGAECSGCASCGACPIVHIKAGYLLAAVHLA